MAPFTVLPELSTAPCRKCAGYGFVEDREGNDCECRACGGSGDVYVCSGCGRVPTVMRGLDYCGCAAALGVAA